MKTMPSAPVTDADLLEKLEKAKGSPAFSLLKAHLEAAQAQRNETTARRAVMTAVERRRDETRELLVSAELKHDERYHLHSVLALCGLPYRRPENDAVDFVREYGKNSLVVQAGYLKDPNTGKMTRQGLPYGPKARLLMLHICTMALRQNSHQIEISDSMSAFIRELGYPVTGGPKGTINAFKEQLHRLAASRMQIGLWNGERATTINSQPIEAFDIWLPQNPDQKVLWTSTLHLDERFFRSLKEHALPVDIRAMRAFAHSARQIDITLWLAYRVRSLKRPYLITWELLREQFGSDVSRDRKFREEFKKDLAAIKEVYPKLPANLGADGLKLFPADPKDLFVSPKKAIGSRRA